MDYSGLLAAFFFGIICFEVWTLLDWQPIDHTSRRLPHTSSFTVQIRRPWEFSNGAQHFTCPRTQLAGNAFTELPDFKAPEVLAIQTPAPHLGPCTWTREQRTESVWQLISGWLLHTVSKLKQDMGRGAWLQIGIPWRHFNSKCDDSSCTSLLPFSPPVS